MALTQKQEMFCLHYIETGNASEAYRRSYSAEKMKSETITRKAKDLIDNGNIAARLEELRAPVREKAGITLEKHLRELETLRELAKAESKYAAAIVAETNRGKASGLYVERHAIGGDSDAPPIAVTVDTSAAMAAIEAKLAKLISKTN